MREGRESTILKQRTERRDRVRIRQAALALALLGLVSSLCLKGMKMVGESLEGNGA